MPSTLCSTRCDLRLCASSCLSSELFWSVSFTLQGWVFLSCHCFACPSFLAWLQSIPTHCLNLPIMHRSRSCNGSSSWSRDGWTWLGSLHTPPVVCGQYLFWSTSSGAFPRMTRPATAWMRPGTQHVHPFRPLKKRNLYVCQIPLSWSFGLCIAEHYRWRGVWPVSVTWNVQIDSEQIQLRYSNLSGDAFDTNPLIFDSWSSSDISSWLVYSSIITMDRFPWISRVLQHLSSCASHATRRTLIYFCRETNRLGLDIENLNSTSFAWRKNNLWPAVSHCPSLFRYLFFVLPFKSILVSAIRFPNKPRGRCVCVFVCVCLCVCLCVCGTSEQM